MPGMGGVFNNGNFIENCRAWHRHGSFSDDAPLALLRLAPITGAVENIGWCDEESFYPQLLAACVNAGLPLSIGDGTPDIKLQAGIAALTELHKKAAVFIKPYPDAVFFKRMEWTQPVAEIIGIDIDSYNIVTMRNLVHLEQKNAQQLKEIKKHANVPFAIKGAFTETAVQMVQEVKPDIAVISNHGGRVETLRGSTADFLAAHYKQLKKYCSEVWVDGGIRTSLDLRVARSLGATTCMIGRPIITALLRDGPAGVKAAVENLKQGKARDGGIRR